MLPKGSDFYALAFADVSLVCSQVNSFPRAVASISPIRLACALLSAYLLESLGIEEIEADSCVMAPKLLER